MIVDFWDLMWAVALGIMVYRLFDTLLELAFEPVAKRMDRWLNRREAKREKAKARRSSSE